MELLEIEKDLAGPNAEEALTRYDATLVKLGERVQKALREGVLPDEYDRVEKLDEVVTIARKLLRLQVKSSSNMSALNFSASPSASSSFPIPSHSNSNSNFKP